MSVVNIVLRDKDSSLVSNLFSNVRDLTVIAHTSANTEMKDDFSAHEKMPNISVTHYLELLLLPLVM